MKIWKELLIDLQFKYFKLAVVDICKTRVEISAWENIPALIREKAEFFRLQEKKSTNSFKQLFEGYKREAATPQEVRKFLKESGFKVKTIPQTSGR